MSTKIYTGCKVDVSTIEELLVLTSNFRLIIENLAEEKQKKFGGTYTEWRTRQQKIKSSGYRDPEVDTEFSISFFPWANYFLGICHVEEYKWFDLWLTQENVHEFIYYDNTDKPDNVSEVDWEKRDVIWNEVCPGILYKTSFEIKITS